jgi:hypothetical protein
VGYVTARPARDFDFDVNSLDVEIEVTMLDIEIEVT